MPLNRKSITIASRVMLPTYILFALVVGVIYILDPNGSLGNSPALRYQNEVLPWPVWGGVLVAEGLAMAVAWFVSHRRMVFAFVLAMYAVTMLLLSVTNLVGIIVASATPLAPLYPFFIAVASTASIASLVNRDK